MASDKKKLKSWPEDVLCDPMVLRRYDKIGMYLFYYACEETGTQTNKGTIMRHPFTVHNWKNHTEISVQHQEA